MRRTRYIRAALAIIVTLTIGGTAASTRPAHAVDFTVTTTTDNLLCVPGNCSLRGAIIEANALAGPDVIILPAGTYLLGIGGADGGADVDNNAAKGDLDVITGSSISIEGAGLDQTIIDGNGDVTGDRVFDVNTGATLEIREATVTNGKAGFGFVGHAHGGGIHSHGTVNLSNVVLSGNRVVIDGAWGGGMTNAGGALASLSDVTVRDNEALTNVGSGGGIENLGNLALYRATLANNQARNGGGILNVADGVATLTNVTVSTNRAVFNGIGGGYGCGVLHEGNGTLVGQFSCAEPFIR